jgi:hypothetical protein
MSSLSSILRRIGHSVWLDFTLAGMLYYNALIMKILVDFVRISFSDVGFSDLRGPSKATHELCWFYTGCNCCAESAACAGTGGLRRLSKVCRDADGRRPSIVETVRAVRGAVWKCGYAGFPIKLPLVHSLTSH